MPTCTEVRKIVDGDAEQSEDGIRITDIYRVKYNGYATTLAALDATDGVRSIPAFYSAHENDSALLVTSRRARYVGESKLMLDVSVTYSYPRGNFTTPPDSTTAKWDIQISVAGIENVETVDKDRDGKPVLTSAGEPYPLALERVFYDEVINVTFKTRTVDVEALGDARGRTNAGTVTLSVASLGYSREFPAETLKVGNVSYDLQVDADGEFYWLVNLPLLYRSQLNASDTEVGWKKMIVDQGFYALYGDDYGRLLDKDSLPRVTPTYLDGAGEPLAEGADAVLLTFALEPTISFDSLLEGIS